MLTVQDIDLLLEAVEAWEAMPQMSSSLGGMIGAMLAPSKEERLASIRGMAPTAKEKKDMKLRKERATLIKAELIRMKQSAAAEPTPGLRAAASAWWDLSPSRKRKTSPPPRR